MSKNNAKHGEICGQTLLFEANLRPTFSPLEKSVYMFLNHPNFKDQYSDIEWRDVIAFRNILVHAYFSVELDIVWETIQQDVPILRDQVTRILEQGNDQ